MTEEADKLLANGFDEAHIGNCAASFRAIYSLSKMIDIMLRESDMDYFEAREYLDSNVINCYIGKATPIYLNDIDVV